MKLDFSNDGPVAVSHRLVDQLPARERAVVLLRFYGQASYREIAETLGVSQKTVAIRLARGRRRLQSLSQHLFFKEFFV